MSEKCPCGSTATYVECCQKYHKGALPLTAEQLMRARYTAHVKAEIDFILETTHPKMRSKINLKTLQHWVQESDWKGLQVLKTRAGGTEDSKGVVEFKAYFEQNNQQHCHHERSNFEKIEGKWYFVDGLTPNERQASAPKIGRNSPCPCGSGRKFKQCCGK